ncbi:MAG: hypothetical protein Q8N23_20485 [Archangium sp.]|nr:hypothetical protein [Archangium sp.]MDP3572079.1 hypothetical protein [Archangium sp.]
MERLRLLTFTSLAVLSACAPPDSALRVNVTVRMVGTTRVRADCIRLTISSDTQELKSLTIKRPADDTAVFGVRRGSDLPASVKVQASGYLGSNCSDDSTLKLNAQGEAVTGAFPESGVSELAVNLDPPSSALDGDRDGFVGAARGGLDCKDDDNTIFPGAGQICASTADTDCDGQTGCDDSECGSASVCADPPDRVVITSTIATMLRYECRGPFRVELHNVNGVRTAIRNTDVALATSLPGVTVHGVATCNDAPQTSLPIPYGASFFEVYLKADGQAFGLNTLTAAARLVTTPGSTVVEVHPQPIDHLEFTSPVRTVSAGACSTETVNVEFRDMQNRRTDVDVPTTISLSSTPGDIGNANIFFDDASCMADGSVQQLLPGQGAVAVHVNAARAGVFSLRATSDLLVATQNLNVQSATASKLAFTNGPVVLSTTQMCSAALFTVQLQDQFDNPVTAVADVPVRLSVTGLVAVSLFEDNGCTSAAQTDFVIPAGSASVSFRARGMTAPPNQGDIRANVLNGAAIADATQMLRVSAGMATRFAMTGSAQSPLASVCSANPFSVDIQDSAGNPASSPTPLTITLSTSPAADPSFRFFSGAGCQTDLNGSVTVPPGQSSATFYYRGNKTFPSFEIRGASGTLSAPSTFLPGNSIRPNVPAKLVFVAPFTQTAQAGTCSPSPYLANVLDLFDNPTSYTTAQTATVAASPVQPGFTAGGAACNVGNSVPLGAGANQLSFIAQHTVAAPFGLTATLNGFSTAVPATFNVTPGPSMLSVETPVNGSATVAAGGCQRVTLNRRDQYQNNAPTSGVTPVALQFPASTTWVVYSSVDCTTGANATISMNSTHTVSFSVSPRTAGAHLMTASILSGSQSAVVNFQVNPGSASFVFTDPATGTNAATASQVAGGCTPVSLIRRDAFMNDVPLGTANSLMFSLAMGTTVHSGTPCSGANVIGSLPMAATEARATVYVRATKSSMTGGPQAQNVGFTLASQSANLTLTVSPAAPTLSILLPVGGAATLAARQCQRVNVERRDVHMNLVPAAGPNLTVTPTANLEAFGSTDCSGTAITNIPVTAGTSTRDFSVRSDLASTTPRALTVTLDGQTAPLTLTINPGPTSVLAVLGLPTSMVSGGCVGPLTLRRRDAYGNDVLAGGVNATMTSSEFTFSSASDCSSASNNLMVAIADGSAVSGNFFATATVAGPATMTATLGAVVGTGNLTVNAGPPNQLAFTTPARSFIAGLCGGASNVITVQARDAAGNPTNALAGGLNFTAVSTSGTGTWFTNNTCATTANGGNFTIPQGSNSVSLFYRDSTIGTPSVTLTSALVNPNAQTHSVMVGPPARLFFTTVPRTFTAAECPGAANVITVQLQDIVGNPVNAGPGGQAFTATTTSAGPVTWFTDDLCASTAAAGAFTIPQGSNSVSLYYRDARAGSPSVQLTNGSGLMNPTAQVHTVNAGPPSQLVFTSGVQNLPALTCSAATVVTAQDVGGNTVNAGMNRVITLSAAPGPANTVFYSNSGCTTALASSQITMSSGNSAVTVYFRAENPASLTLTADSPALTSGTQAATITAAMPTKLVIPTAGTTVEAGFCHPVAVERRDALDRLATPAVATVITPVMAPTTGALLFTDAACTVAAGATVSIASGQSSTTLYLKGISGSLSGIIPGNQAYTLTLNSGSLTSDNTIVTVQPMVRRRSGACTLGNLTVTCPLTPTLADITRTMLFFQAAPTGTDDNPSDDNVTCRLNPNAGVAEVVCERNANGANVTIEFQTLSFPYPATAGGVTVQHLTGGCTAAATTAMPLNLTVPISANPANSFVLFSSRSVGTQNDADHFFTGQLTSATNLRFSQAAASTTCTSTVDFVAQVVTWAGATVSRGLQAGGSGLSFTAPVTGATGGFLVYSTRAVAADTSNSNICRRRARGEITNATTLTFTRGCNSADLQDISWELVKLPTGGGAVQQVNGATTAGNAATASLSFSSVDLTRSVMFLGGQGPGGSATGSTSSPTDRVGTGLATVNVSSSTAMTYVRGNSDQVGSFTGYVMQVNP